MLADIKIKNYKTEFLKQIEPIHFKNEKDIWKKILPKGIHYFREENRMENDEIRVYRIDNLYTDILVTIIDGKLEEKNGNTTLKVRRMRNKMKISWQVIFFLIPFVIILLMIGKGNTELLYGIIGSGILFCMGVEGYKIKAMIKGIQYLKKLKTKRTVELLEYPVEMRRKVSNKNWQKEFNMACPSIETEELKERMTVRHINFFEKTTYWRENTMGKKQNLIEFYRIDSHFITKSMICFRGVYEEKKAFINLGITGYKMKFPVVVFVFGIEITGGIFGNWIWGIIYGCLFLFGYFIYRKIFFERGIQETMRWMESFFSCKNSVKKEII